VTVDPSHSRNAIGRGAAANTSAIGVIVRMLHAIGRLVAQ
jgi:hypothetical protein